MKIEGLIEDVSNICELYLTQEEKIYISSKWAKFNNKEVCRIAAENGWLDLLKWAQQNGCIVIGESWTCILAAQNGHLEVLKWAIENGYELDIPWEDVFFCSFKWYSISRRRLLTQYLQLLSFRHIKIWWQAKIKRLSMG